MKKLTLMLIMILGVIIAANAQSNKLFLIAHFIDGTEHAYKVDLNDAKSIKLFTKTLHKQERNGNIAHTIIVYSDTLMIGSIYSAPEMKHMFTFGIEFIEYYQYIDGFNWYIKQLNSNN